MNRRKFMQGITTVGLTVVVAPLLPELQAEAMDYPAPWGLTQEDWNSLSDFERNEILMFEQTREFMRTVEAEPCPVGVVHIGETFVLTEDAGATYRFVDLEETKRVFARFGVNYDE